MQCPRDQAELQTETQRGIEVDKCPQCNGRWLDEGELSQLEATVKSTEEQRIATIEYANRESTLDCPTCGTQMQAFNYRAYDLELDVCVNRHGIWLDAGEDSRVRDIIEDRVRRPRASGEGRGGMGQVHRRHARRRLVVGPHVRALTRPAARV